MRPSVEWASPLEVLFQGYAQRYVLTALHLAQSWLDISPRGGQSALSLIRVGPPIHLGAPLFDQRIDRLQVISRGRTALMP